MKKDVEREAFILEEMKDPLVLGAYGIVRIDERELWLVMDKAKYGSVMSYMRRYPSPEQIPLFLLFGIMKDICAAVAHLHSHGVTHKDIKAENILLHNGPYEFCVKLCDFGLAKQESLSGETALPTMFSKTGAGTQPFMAPELKNESLGKGRRSSSASDVFAMCITFIQLLTRRVPIDDVFGYQSQIHGTLLVYFNNHTLRENHQKLYGSDDGVSNALNRLMRILYEGLSLEPVPSDLNLSRVLEIPRIYYNPDSFDPWKRPFAKDVTQKLSDILDSYLGGDGRKGSSKLSSSIKGDSAFIKNQRLVKQFVSAFDEGTDVDYESIGGISNSTSSLKIGGDTLPPTPPLSPSSTLLSISDQDKEMVDELVNWFTDLNVQKMDALQYATNMFNKKLSTVTRLKKYVDKHGYGVLRDELEIDDMDADEIEEALSSSKNSEQSKDIPSTQKDVKDLPVVIDPVKTTVDAKLIRTDADIQDAVKLWCSNRPEAESKYGHITDWDTSAVTNMRELFEDCTEFNDDISQWNVGNVTNMWRMFYGAAAFNQDIGQWNVSENIEQLTLYHNEVSESDIELVIRHAGCTRAEAILALLNNEDDIVNAIMELTEF